MAMTRHERKDALGHGAITRIARRTKRAAGHVSQVINCEKTHRRDEVVEKEAARILGRDRFEVFPPLEQRAGAA